MKNNTNTVAKKQEQSNQTVAQDQLVVEEGVANNAQKDCCEAATPAEEKIYYCDLTGVPLN